ncbi:hypothetical protein DVP62_10310 [Yersinia enterocolitica]|nr:hypothetical protein [Yersinia enterocolitica]EKN5143535.1 hypothetical protein [Yersinia enterocolitica]EKN6239887.1 hypothetical protein [Yersinia enterocolitica]
MIPSLLSYCLIWRAFLGEINKTIFLNPDNKTGMKAFVTTIYFVFFFHLIRRNRVISDRYDL